MTIERVADLTLEHHPPRGRGRRLPLLLVHGMWGGSWYWRRYLRVAADAGWDVWAVNLRGHHGSRPVRHLGGVSVREYVQDVGVVLDAIGPAVIVGHSMGGLIAQRAATRPDVRAAAFVTSAPPRGIVALRWASLSRLARYMPAMVAHQAFELRNADAIALLMNGMSPAAQAAALPHFVPESGRAGLELALGLLAVNAGDVRCPTLVMGASNDRITPVPVQRRIAGKYRAEYLEAAGRAHMLMLEDDWQPPCRQLLDWLAAHS